MPKFMCQSVGVGSTFYEILGVQPNSPSTEIRRGYLRQALVTHPDKGGTKEQFAAVSLAFETLANGRARSSYDQKLRRQAPHCGVIVGARNKHPCPSHEKAESKGITTAQPTHWQHASSETGLSPVHSQPGVSPSCARGMDYSKLGSRADSQIRQTKIHAMLQSRLECVILRLRACIAFFPKGKRKEALDFIPIHIRRLLASFMEGLASSKSMLQVRSVESFREDDSNSTSDTSSLEEEGEQFMIDNQAVEVLQQSWCEVSKENAPASPPRCFTRQGQQNTIMKGCFHVKPAEHRPEPRLLNSRGVSRVGKKYQVRICWNHLGIAAYPISSLEEAITVHALLVHLKDSLSEKDVSSRKFISEFDELLDGVCSEFNVHRHDVALAFWSIVHYPGTGRNVYGKVVKDLGPALAQRQQLLSARTQGWESFRAVWVGILEEKFHRAQAEALVDARYAEGIDLRAARAKSQDARMEGKESRLHAYRLQRLDRSVRAVARVLEKQDRIAKRREEASAREAIRQATQEAKRLAHLRRVTETQVQSRRAALKRWENDPRRTLEEIMQGPPSYLRGRSRSR